MLIISDSDSLLNLVLDEAFPEMSIDFVCPKFSSVANARPEANVIHLAQILVEGPFQPASVAALAHRLQIPRSLMFISCPGDACPYTIDEFGTRIITL